MEKAGWVKSSRKTVKGKRHRYYRATRKGRGQFEQALIALNQFLFEGLPTNAAPRESSAQEKRSSVETLPSLRAFVEQASTVREEMNAHGPTRREYYPELHQSEGGWARISMCNDVERIRRS